jgi:HlyD family secretion protein
MKRKPILIAGVAILVIAIVILSLRGGGPTGTKVTVEPVARKTIESTVTAPGQVDPKVKVNVSAHIVGKIEKLYFTEGETVHQGQKLVDLEKHIYIAQRDRATSMVASARVEVQRARAALNTSEAAYKRAQNLANQGIQAQELFDQTRLGYDNAVAGLAAAEQGVKQAQASLRQASEDVLLTTIVSPIDGKVVELNAHEGEVVVTGTMNNPGSVIAVIADLSEILVEAEVGETEVVGIRLNQRAKVRVDAIPDHEYAGHVEEIGSSAAVRQGAGAGIRYFKVKVAIDDPDDRLRPGMTSHVATVPIQAVVDRIPGEKADASDEDGKPKKKYVFLAAKNKAKQVEVTTGISDSTHVSIVSGVKAGESVITGPFRAVKKMNDGEDIDVTKEEKKTASKDAGTDKGKDKDKE